ncbi:fatty acid desaturase-domain-containing protein [Zychaea mexicana]|uniref:fatty acid desaturase-domain-containing protein n=1 Tax=Zychaea mexicana TaxID=64656 RepID=UPI0022FF1ED7|nr:fatty acid desaturase-domain-containing protein [Zychaea mexicana]KAI9490662.1 fatty acid desaturase-domain-containing protein [Zychaea mexicana]
MPPFVETIDKDSVPVSRQKQTAQHQETQHPDYRFPLYLGRWKRSIPYVHEDFARDDMDEPHLKRKHTILREHPEIEKLYGTDIRTLYVAIAINVVQLWIAYYFGRVWTPPAYVFIGVAYFVGATLTGVIGVIIHEACHCLVTKTKILNRYVGLLANICLPVPIAQSFRRYHIQHHSWQGVEGLDPDLPLEWEKTLIQGNALCKLLWIMIYPFMYVIRGAVMQSDRNLTPSKWEIINTVFTVAMDTLITKTCGWRGLGYLFLSLYLGYSLHPGAAHFIQEHYTFDDGQETYSYYGILNIPFMNIGYHNEHHDFQKIPWSKLPKLRSTARDYYDKLSYHTSWIMVHWMFIFQNTLGPQSRLVRTYKDFKQGRSLLGKMRVYEEKQIQQRNANKDANK